MVALLIAVARPLQPASAAVFGEDDRRAVPPQLRAISANIGVLLDPEQHAVCTAFCVGNRTIATAAHCLVRKGDHSITRPQSFSFALLKDGGSTPAAPVSGSTPGAMSRLAPGGTVAAVVAGSPTLRLKPPIDSSGDWALARLDQPVCTAGGLRLSTLSAADVRASYAARHAVDLAFHKDRPQAGILAGGDCGLGEFVPGLSPQRLAREFSRPGNLLVHTCDTAGGSSGSPIVADGAFGPEVVAINVGTYVQSTLLMEHGEVVARSSNGAIANTAASSAPVAIALAEFDADEPVSDPGSLSEVEVLLAAIGAPSLTHSGGTGGAGLSHAILAYQHASGLPATGIATRGLLQRLRDEAQAPAAAALLRRQPLETGSTR